MIRSHSLLLLVAAFLPATAPAAVVVYAGIDAGASSAMARPNSDAARASFLAAVGSATTFSFEGPPLGPFASRALGGGYTVAQSNSSGGFSQNASTVAGYNTTAAGSTFLQFIPSDNPATLRFNATTPFSAFGAYFTGVGTSSGDIALRFNDGTQQSLPVPTSSTGGVQFFGFTSSGSQLTQVEFHMSNVPATGSVDFWGIDDATFATVPEPAALTAAAATSLLLRRRRKVR